MGNFLFDYMTNSAPWNKSKPVPSLDTILESFDQEMNNFQTSIKSTPESKPRTPFKGNLPREKLSMYNLPIGEMLSVLPVMGPLLFQMQRSKRLYDGKFKPSRSEADPAFLAEIERMAKEAGVSDIKYIKVPPKAIFQDKSIPHEYAIVLTVEMDRKKISTAPSFAAFKEVATGYKNLAVISSKLSHFMRKNGFAAYPGTSLGGLSDYVQLAELAGLGAIGYHGLLISPNEGTRLRINTIYTNITNLPIETENQHLWVKDYCSICRKCIRECPPQAIFEQPHPRGDGAMQCIDHSSCRDYFDQNLGCAICLATCPFSKAGYDKVKAGYTAYLAKSHKIKSKKKGLIG